MTDSDLTSATETETLQPGFAEPALDEPAPAPTPASSGLGDDMPPDRPGLTDWRLPFALPKFTPAGLALDIFLVALILIGLFFRFSWTNWNQGTDLHPDEYGLTGTLTQLSIPKSIGEYFNTRLSPISPYQKYDVAGNPLPISAEYRAPDNRMRWGQWPLIIIRWVAEMSGNTGYGELRLMGRRLSALFDSLALIVIFLIGWQLYKNYRVGLLAAALSALAVMQIQQSHFMTVDNFAVFFVTAAMFCAVRVAQNKPVFFKKMGLWGWYILFGVFFGMAMASRVNLLPLFGLIGVAAVIAHADDWNTGHRSQIISDVAMRLALAGLVAFITFRVTQPMSFRAKTGDTTILTLTPNQEWMDSMAVASAESSGQGGGPPGEQWTNRPALIFPWINMVLWGMGLPLGLTAWAAFAWATWRSMRPGDDWKAHALPLVWAGGYFLFMGTRWVKSVRYFLPIYPFLILLAAWAIFEVWGLMQRKKESDGRTGLLPLLRSIPSSFFLLVTLGTLAWAWGFTNVYRSGNTRVNATEWIFQNIPAPLNLKILQADGTTYTDPLPMPFGTQVGADAPAQVVFRARVTGALTGLSLAHIHNAFGDQVAGTLHVKLSQAADGSAALAEADVPIKAIHFNPRGDLAEAPFGPITLIKGETYYLFLTAPQGGPLEINGSTLANESWDESLPVRYGERDPFGGLYRGLTVEARWQDDANKKQMFLDNLAQVDYLILPSQRAIWSSGRLPNNYPMTMEYYRALFDGRLGFELIKTFQNPITIGPLQISDIAATWAWGQPPDLPARGADFPFNNSQLAAEEAFSVYDHAPVWIFKKTDKFSLEQARAILDAVDLSMVVNQGPREATAAPTLLMLPADRWADQQAGGTWRDIFNPQAFFNQNEFAGVALWWGVIFLLGVLAFPLTYVVFGGLADRGYAFSRAVALVGVAWLVWILGSLELLPFTRLTILLCLLVFSALSAFVFWRKRAEIVDFVRVQRRHLLMVEGVLLALFLFDLFIRWGNPDLWHPNFGGERPMIFSFFNAVLKSTSFPPYNPWMSGAFLNYYYYGFVILAVPVKLLGIVPTFAYNLLLPTLFSLTGLHAFSVAYNLVKRRGTVNNTQPTVNSDELLVISHPSAIESPQPETNPAESESPTQTQTPTLPPTPPSRSIPLGHPRTPTLPNPYLAGIAAALLVVVLGNLGQVYTLFTGFQRIGDRTAFAGTFIGAGDTSALLDGARKFFSGEATLPIGNGDWYWTASRVVSYLNESSDITEFPFFTFLYSDMHAHMIDMPLALMALAWAVSYLFDRRQRDWIDSAAVWAVGGLVVGVTNPTNSWDFPAVLALGLIAVTTAHFLKDPRLSRTNVLSLAWRLALLGLLAFGLYWPFDQWFAPAYSEAKRNLNTFVTLSGYIYMYGLFLFIIVSFLLWETRRWLAETPATVVTTAGEWLPWLGLALVGVVLGVAAFWYLKVVIALIALPLMAWAGLLLMRSPQAMPPEKQAVLFLIGTALALTLFVELFSVGADRMNTIFKFYIQVWLFLSVVGGAALAWLWAELPRWSPRWSGVWAGGLAVLVFAAATYTVTAASAKLRDRFPQYVAQPYGVENPGCQQLPNITPPASYTSVDNGATVVKSLAVGNQPHSLDAMDFMAWSAYCDSTYFVPLAYDAEAIRWMQENVVGSPTIVEANVTEYRWGNRFTIYTGLPGVVGWNYHTRQHRGIVSSEMVTRRVDEIQYFYCTPTLTGGVADFATLPEPCQRPVDYATIDYNWVINFLQKYDVHYVIVGAYERAVYPAAGLAKFEFLKQQGVLMPVYENPATVIYQVSPTLTGQ